MILFSTFTITIKQETFISFKPLFNNTKKTKEKYITDKCAFPFEEHIPEKVVEVWRKYCEHKIEDKKHIYTITKGNTVIECTISCDEKCRQATIHTRKFKGSHIEHGGQTFRKYKALSAYTHNTQNKHTDTVVNYLIKLFTPDAVIHNEQNNHQNKMEFSKL